MIGVHFHDRVLTLLYDNYHLQTPILKNEGLEGPRGFWQNKGWFRPTSQKIIRKDIVTIIGCQRHEVQIERVHLHKGPFVKGPFVAGVLLNLGAFSDGAFCDGSFYDGSICQE
jgi:hypothetical protein